ncbi:MAG TPA: transglycosylase SLT domain-containing protein [Pyrinomonadaceae bacterium]|nr:transglycosylase SLT domain-containing protein [Pyrinomonadaceae bacterium]
MAINFRKHRLTLIIVGLAVVIGASIAPFMSASCSTHPQRRIPGEVKALEQLRSMTRGGVMPAEDVVARIESDFPNTKAAGLARILRARIKIKMGDFAGGISLLDSAVIRERTSLGDYALLLRARALEQLGRRTEARADYEKISRDYPTSLQAGHALRRDAEMLLEDNEGRAVPVLLKDLNERDDAAALLLTGKAYEQSSDTTRALAAYRRIYFGAPASAQSVEAAALISKLNSTTAPATAEEAVMRADRLYDAKKYGDAAGAYNEAFTRFPNTARPEAQLRRGIAATNSKRSADAVAALNSVPSSAAELRAEALFYLTQNYANSRQWEMARAATDELRRAFPASSFAPRALVRAGEIARDAKSLADASYFFRTAVNSYPGTAEVAQAQFEIAWASHDAKNYQESSQLLTEHLANYADKNTDNRGRAGYWAARDSERAGKLAEARALYEAMQARYNANWYGYLSLQRLETMKRTGNAPAANFAPDSLVGRAAANLKTVFVAEETAGQDEIEHVTKADQLSNIGINDWALEELDSASQAAPSSPRINLALARLFRSRTENVRAINTLRKSFPDYAQMKPGEMTREEWDVFYPLSYWDIITQEARNRRLDPHQVAGLIRQESVFDPRAASPAKAYGLMQLLVPTGAAMARKYGVDRAVTVDALFEPRLNIQLGTGYMRDQFDKFGRIEYVAVAYNAGPGRVPQWRATLPLEMDEFAEAIPFKETRGYVQGVVRNTLQYERLYDDNGQFRPEVGARALHRSAEAEGSGAPVAAQAPDETVIQRRFTGSEHGE